MGRSTAVVTAFLILGFVGGMSLTAGAHDPPNGADYIQRFWDYSAVDIATANLNAVGTHAQVIADANTASQNWDNVSSNPNWGYFSNSNASATNLYYSTPDMCANTSPLKDHDVWVGHAWQSQLPGGGSMGAKRCTWTDGRITRSYIGVVLFPAQGGQEWHFGNTKPPGSASPNDKRSFVGSIAHEFGHVVGFGAQSTYIHFPVTNPLNVACDNSPKVSSDATMCDAGPPFHHTRWYYRTLQAHDEHTFRYAYDTQ